MRHAAASASIRVRPSFCPRALIENFRAETAVGECHRVLKILNEGETPTS
jgi:hypothetical protein